MANRSTEDFENNREKQAGLIGAGLDFVFGALFIIIGVVCFVKYKADNLMLVFGGVAIVYGLWKIYKGYKKKSI